MILRSTFAQAPLYPFVCYLTKRERVPLISEMVDTFGEGGYLPTAGRVWICGSATPDSKTEPAIFWKGNGHYVAFQKIEDQVLFRLKYEGRKID